MAIFPECYIKKPIFAPRCAHCTKFIGFLCGVFFNLVYSLLSLIFFIGLIYLFFAITS
jgi:hypothetical protein